MSRTYNKILTVLKRYYPQRMANWVIRERFVDVFGYEPNCNTIKSDLCRAVKDGVIKRDENGFYYIDNVDNEN